jgi:hypothetical protein
MWVGPLMERAVAATATPWAIESPCPLAVVGTRVVADREARSTGICTLDGRRGYTGGSLLKMNHPSK